MAISDNGNRKLFNVQHRFWLQLEPIVSLCAAAYKVYVAEHHDHPNSSLSTFLFAQRTPWLRLENMTTSAFRILIFIGCLLAPLDANADGDDFFEIIDVPLENQLIFVGTVKDEDGNYLRDALVRWRATGPVGDAGDEHTSTAGTWTNVLGRFRTVDVARIVAREGAELNPERVEFSVEKPGYVMVRRLVRNRGRQSMGLQEIDFVMRKSEQTEDPR